MNSVNTRNRYSEKELKEILTSITVLVDTREKRDEHILSWFESKSISYKKQALSFGDYSFYIPPTPILGTMRDTYFDKDIIIERKVSLEELSVNLAQQRERFEHEWLRAGNTRKLLLVESGCLSDIWDNAYGTNFKPSSYMGSLLSFQNRYGIEVMFMPQKYTGQFIYSLFWYHLKGVMQNGL